MALNRGAKVCPEDEQVGKVVTEEEEQEGQNVCPQGFIAGNFRRLSLWLRRSSSVGSLKGMREIPGQSFALVEYLLLRTFGLETFTRKIEKLESTIFRFNLGMQAIFLCDWKSVQNSFDSTKIVKERRFGRKVVNRAILDNHIPTMFSNGIDHAKKKAFMMSISKWVEKQFLLQSLVKVVPEYLKTWNTIAGASDEVDLECQVLQLTAAILSDAFFGTMLNFDCMQTWKAAIFRKPIASKPYQRLAMEAYDDLYNTIVNCPKISVLLTKGREEGLTDDETVKEVFFAAVFNAFPAISYVLISTIGRLTLLSEDYLNSLREEIKTELQDGLTRKSLKKLKRLENFVLEVLRMAPPAPLLFGRARYDFVMESNSCLYQIKKDDMLVGSIYQVQRDPVVFTDPCEFDPGRFEDKRQRKHLIAFGGNFDETAKAHTHKCAGQSISVTILKVVVLYLLNCHIKLKEDPEWTGKKLKRFGRPDEPLELDEFLYREPPFSQSQTLEVLDIDEEEISTCTKESFGEYNGAMAILKLSGKMKARGAKKRSENIYEGL